MRLFRCEHAFWLVDSGQVKFDDVIPSGMRELLRDGVNFERAMVSVASVAPERPLSELFREDHFLVGLPMLKNSKRRLSGVPDGVATRHGDLVPIEIKNHQSVLRSDRLELCFYDLLLEPYRSGPGTSSRVGLLQLKDRAEMVEVALRELDFEVVSRLIARVRFVRRSGVEPHNCLCPVCITREECAPAVSRGSPGLIHGLGFNRARLLESLGIKTISDVLNCDAEAVCGLLRSHQHAVSVRGVSKWRAHAKALLSRELVWIGGEHVDLPRRFLAIDLEYIVGRYIWMFGIALVDGDQVDVRQFWIESRDEIPAALRNLGRILKEWPEGPVLTWNGFTGDLPQLRRSVAKRSAGYTRMLSNLEARHLDLHHHVQRNLRYPVPFLSLKALGDFYGVKRTSMIDSGMEAVGMYSDYLHETSRKKRAELRARLLDYNADDLFGLVAVARELAKERPPGDSIGVSHSLTAKARRKRVAATRASQTAE